MPVTGHNKIYGGHGLYSLHELRGVEVICLKGQNISNLTHGCSLGPIYRLDYRPYV